MPSIHPDRYKWVALSNATLAVLLATLDASMKNYRQGDWNEIEVTVKDGAAYSLCNGELLEAAQKVPATGWIGLEGDQGQMEYRRIRLREEQ